MQNLSAVLLAGSFLCMVPVAASAQSPGSVAPAASTKPFHLKSTSFADGGVIPPFHALNARGCVGANRSPQLSWENAPVSTKSFAIMLYDYDGAKSTGVTHWVTYNIPSSVTGLAENAGADSAVKYAGGKNFFDTASYMGPCPRPGDDFHHYVFTVYALDLPPNVLSPGLDAAAVRSLIRDHIIVAASLVGRSIRAPVE